MTMAARASSSGGGAESAQATDGDDPLRIGDVLDGRYRVDAVLGRGAIGVVYRGEHLALQRQIAIKVLYDEMGSVEELRARFEREAQALSSLSHPNIVAVTDFGIASHTPYLVTELLEGATLAELIETGPPDVDVGLGIIQQALRAVAFAHERGVIHRDLKAANMFLVALPEEPHHVKILDFGLAKVCSSDSGSADVNLTQAGTILGTPAYMAPEQALGGVVDERADIYSMGIVLFETLTGRTPFEAKTRAAMMRSHMIEPVPSLSTRREGLVATPALEAIIAKSLAKDVGDRFQSAPDMVAAMEALPTPAAEVEEAPASRKIRKTPARKPRQAPATSAGPKVAADGPGLGARARAAAGRGALRATMWLGRAIVRRARDPLSVPSLLAAAALLLLTVAVFTVPWRAAEGALADKALKRSDAATSLALPNPWLASAPADLTPFIGRALRGQPFDQDDMRALAELQRAHPEDGRPSLIMARHFVHVGYLSVAVARYELAWQAQPSCRGDQRMLRDLLRLTRSDAVGERAADLLHRAYGEEALPMVEDELKRRPPGPERARLRRLRRLLRS